MNSAYQSGQPRSDLLEQPAIAIRIAERGERAVTASGRLRAAEAALLVGMMEGATDIMERLAHVGTAGCEIGARGLDVSHEGDGVPVPSPAQPR